VQSAPGDGRFPGALCTEYVDEWSSRCERPVVFCEDSSSDLSDCRPNVRCARLSATRHFVFVHVFFE